MIKPLAASVLCLLAFSACNAVNDRRSERDNGPPKRIVSLDFCADQYVLKLADREHIAALSPEAEMVHSYMRAQAKGVPKVRPRVEDILLLKPDVVVRSYGGGPNAADMFKRAGIDVVQIGYASNVDAIKNVISNAANDLGVPERGEKLVAEMEARLAALPNRQSADSILYLTSRGAIAGKNTMIDELMARGGFKNFQTTSGWGSIPLERLAYEQPAVIATSFFDTADLVSDIWTPARHPVAQRRLNNARIVNLPGAWTACGGWFMIDVIEALAASIETSSAND